MMNASPHNIRGKSFLPEHYQPSSVDVICARGIKSFYHCGNKSFRKAIADNLEMYGASSDKRDKSMIVSSIANKFFFNDDERKRCRFIRFCDTKKLWYEISYDQVRQKVGQTMRDTLLQQDPQRLSRKKHYRAHRASTRRCISTTATCHISHSITTITTQREEHNVFPSRCSGTISADYHPSIQHQPSILSNGHSCYETVPPLSNNVTPSAQHTEQTVSIPGPEQFCRDLSLANLEWAASVREAALKAANGADALVDSACRLDASGSNTTSTSILPNGHPFDETGPVLSNQVAGHEQLSCDLSLANLEWAASVRMAAIKAANGSNALVDSTCRLDGLDYHDTTSASILPNGHAFHVTTPPHSNHVTSSTAQHTRQHSNQGTPSPDHNVPQNMSIPGQEQRCYDDLSRSNVEWATSVRKTENGTYELVDCRLDAALDSDSQSVSSCHWFQDCDGMSLSNSDWLDDDDDEKFWK